ncbi:MAG: protein kinase, partial [Myxococcota bacterium]|nr:protein kinase [Myxococcota bacterium]
LPQRHDRWKLAWHMTKAIASTHKRGVTHRNLHPGVIYIMEDDKARVPVKIADFDFARIGSFDLVGDMLRQIVKQGYGAPEMWLEDVHDHRVDTYSIGALLFELITATPLYTPAMALLRHNEIWEMRRELLPNDACRQVWDRLLAYDPEVRYNDLHEILPFIEEQAGSFLRDQQPLTGDYGLR